MVCSMQNIKPNMDTMPLDINDFPQIVRDSLEIFNRLPDNHVGTNFGPLYTGKDISSIGVLYDYCNLTKKEDRDLALEIIQHLDKKAVSREVKRYNKAVKDSKGGK